MKKIGKIHLLILILFFTGRIVHAQESKKEFIPVIYESYVDEIINSFAKKSKKEFGLHCCGSGGSMPYDIESISIHFYAYKNASIEEARLLTIKASEKLAQEINAHEKIRPYLRDFPFGANRTEISISFVKPNNRRYTDGSVSYIFHVRDKLFYNRTDPNSGDLIDICDEPYEEALKIVQKSENKNT